MIAVALAVIAHKGAVVGPVVAQTGLGGCGQNPDAPCFITGTYIVNPYESGIKSMGSLSLPGKLISNEHDVGALINDVNAADDRVSEIATLAASADEARVRRTVVPLTPARLAKPALTKAFTAGSAGVLRVSTIDDQAVSS